MNSKQGWCLIGIASRFVRCQVRLNSLVLSILFFGTGATMCVGQKANLGVLPNCPIMTDNQASPEHFADYKGKRYYFCCNSCVEDFLSDPERFANQKSVQGFPLESNDSVEPFPLSDENHLPFYREPEGWDKAIARIFEFRDWLSDTYDRLRLDHPYVRWRFLAMLGACGIALAWQVIAWRRNQTSRQFSKTRQYFVGCIWILLLLAMFDSYFLSHRVASQAAILAQTIKEKQEVESEVQAIADIELAKQIHFGTFVTYGFPPRPRPPQEYSPALVGTYYRGNDERSEAMLNGGHYLTVTFDISLETQSGKTLQYGDPIGSDPVFLSVKFRRANQTSNGYFTSEYMQRMYLTMQANRFLGRDAPVEDRVEWKETTPGRVWEARFELPHGDHFDPNWKQFDDRKLNSSDARGVVYLCEERFKDDRIVGGRYHYGVEYHLVVENSRVLKESKLFMGSIYSGSNFAKYQITDQQWLSTNPIPEHSESR